MSRFDDVGEREHERLMLEITRLLHLHEGATSLDIEEAASKADEATRKEYERLNALNDAAVRRAEKEL